MPTDRHRMEVLWANAKNSRLARREIAQATPRHKKATPKGRLTAVRGGKK